MNASLDISCVKESGIDIVTLSGQLDGHTFIELEQSLRDAITDGSSVFLIDLAGLSYIASSGVGVFINVHQQLQTNGGGLVLARPSPTVKEIFDLLGLSALFPIHQELAHAKIVADRFTGVR